MVSASGVPLGAEIVRVEPGGDGPGGLAATACAMVIYRLIANGSFGPEETKAMTAAYEAALLDLRLVDRDDPITEIVAKAIIGIASTGERDPVTIKDRALNTIRAGQSETEARDTGAFKTLSDHTKHAWGRK